MLLGTLDAGVLGNFLTRKGIYRVGKDKGKGINRVWEGVLRASYGRPSYSAWHKNEPRFTGVYSRDKLLKVKYGAYIINLDESSDIGTHWVSLYMENNNVTYFDFFWCRIYS